MNEYENLPGVNIDVRDGEMMISEDNTTNSMLVIGEVKAPASVVNNLEKDAVLVRDERDLYAKFGKYMYQGEINPVAAEWYVAKNNGVRNVYILALQGNNDKERFVYLQDMLYEVIADYQFSHIVLTGLYADVNIEDITAEDFSTPEEPVEDLADVSGLPVYYTIRGTSPITLLTTAGETTDLVITQGDLETVITLKDNHETVEELIKDINIKINDSIGNLGNDHELFLEIERNDENQKIAVIRSSVQFEVEGAEVLTSLGINDVQAAPEAIGNPAKLLGNFCEGRESESGAVIAYIATKPSLTTNKADIREHVNNLVSRDNGVSRHVQVVAGPQVGVSLPGSIRTQWLSGVTHYAALVNSLAVQNAPTNQPLPGVNALRYDMSPSQLNRLVGNKYVTFRTKNNRIVVVDGVTTAPDRYVGQDRVFSDFTRLSTLRCVNYLVSAIRSTVDPFIGRPNEFPLYNAMNTEIKNTIDIAISRGVIQDAAYSIELGERLDAAKINMTILPQFELREINISIGLTTPAGFETMNQINSNQ